jgi:hypothetical protein
VAVGSFGMAMTLETPGAGLPPRVSALRQNSGRFEFARNKLVDPSKQGEARKRDVREMPGAPNNIFVPAHGHKASVKNDRFALWMEGIKKQFALI